jgi:hypothetical protein
MSKTKYKTNVKSPDQAAAATKQPPPAAIQQVWSIGKFID